MEGTQLPSNTHTLSSKVLQGASLAVQWLGLHVSNTEHAGTVPGLGTKILHASRHGQETK